MVDVLMFVAAEGDEKKELHQRLLTAKALPGFLVPPEEMKRIGTFLEELADLDITGLAG